VGALPAASGSAEANGHGGNGAPAKASGSVGSASKASH
jgi:hypothetical protein